MRRAGLSLADVGRDGRSSGEKKMKERSKPPHAKRRMGTHERATLYDGVGSVKRHQEFTSREGSFFSSPKRIFSLSCISTKARFVNLAVNVGSTNHLFGLPVRGTMIRSSDPAIARGSKAPNQPSDELAFTRVAPGLPCLRTSCA